MRSLTVQPTGKRLALAALLAVSVGGKLLALHFNVQVIFAVGVLHQDAQILHGEPDGDFQRIHLFVLPPEDESFPRHSIVDGRLVPGLLPLKYVRKSLAKKLNHFLQRFETGIVRLWQTLENLFPFLLQQSTPHKMLVHVVLVDCEPVLHVQLPDVHHDPVSLPSSDGLGWVWRHALDISAACMLGWFLKI